MKKELPILRGEELYIPFVGAIIENDKKEILIQIREKKNDKTHNGRIEIPGGKMQAYEDIYETVRREAKEECGLDITFIDGENKRIDYPNRNEHSTLIEPFCVTQMQEGSCIGLIFICRAIGTPSALTEESREARWISVDELKSIVANTPEQIHTPFLAPLKKYLLF